MRLLAQCGIDRSGRILRRRDHIEAAVLAKRCRDVLARRRVVIRDENADRLYGSTTWTSVPAPGTDSSESRPPTISARSRIAIKP